MLEIDVYVELILKQTKKQFSLCNPTPPQPRLGLQSSHFEALATTVCRLCYKTRALSKINISLFWNIIKIKIKVKVIVGSEELDERALLGIIVILISRERES